jgi:predicted permease
MFLSEITTFNFRSRPYIVLLRRTFDPLFCFQIVRLCLNHVHSIYARMMTALSAAPEGSNGTLIARHASSDEVRPGSCTTCSKAKSKCVRRPGEEVCER